MPLDLTPIRSRLDAATPGPWRIWSGGGFVSVGRTAPCQVAEKRLGSSYGTGRNQAAEDYTLIANAPADLRALLDEVERLRGAVHSALVYCQHEGTDISYGGFHGGDPRDFHPDPECSTEEERTAHADACAAFAAAEGRGERPRLGDTHRIVFDDDGKMICHIATNPFGLGTMTYRDEKIAELEKTLIAAYRRDYPATEPGRE